MKKIIYFILIIVSYFYFTIGVNAAIYLTVSPIKYELEALPGTIINKTATLYNYGENTLTIVTGKSNFTTNGENGIPEIIRLSELVYPDQQLSTWISIETESFIIGPGENKTINFSINIPDDATPGGHYGAVFFKNQNSPSGTNSLGINIDYGVLILLNVDGDVITSGEPENIIITSSNGYGWGNIESIEDDCPLGDFTISRYDKKCIDDFGNIEKVKERNYDNIDFDIIFDIPFKNDGNTHIKPKGKIILLDENGDEIKGVGKEIIINTKGKIVGEKIVDYLPINDIGGNILPNSIRKFQSNWKGFPYKGYDIEGNQILKYWSPGEYYTKKNVKDKGFLMIWERVLERINTKKITALIDLSYKNKEGENVEFNSAKEFKINYIESYIGLNPYVIIPFILFLLLLFIIYIIIRIRKKKCRKCNKRIGRKLKACPYCGKKVKNNKLK